MSDAATVGRAWFEQMWNRRDRDLLQRLMAEDVRGRLESGHIEGRETWVMQVYEPFLAAFPDMHFVVERVLADGEHVAVLWEMTGTQRTALGPIEASGLRVRFRGTTWQTVRDGRIVAGEDCWNMDALYAALVNGRSSASISVLQDDGLPLSSPPLAQSASAG